MAIKKGDKVTTVHGEELEVLDVKEQAQKTKKGQVIEEAAVWVLAKSGENNCWFSTKSLKGAE